jgi:predicted TIM-barrel fold metal-dependent hydrolase
MMRIIDSDAHVEESEATWAYLEEAWHKHRPIPILLPEDTVFGTHNGGWVIDYKLRLFGATPTIMKRSQEKGASIGAQEITDVEERISAMDQMGIYQQIVFPSVWQGAVSENQDLEVALARSYNTFMATQCNQSEGRIKFVAVVPFRQPVLAAAELRRAAGLGSVAGVYARGIEWDMPLSNPAFWPIYEEAARLDLPVTVHTGNGASPSISTMLEGYTRKTGPGYFPHVSNWGHGLVSDTYVHYAFMQLLDSSLLSDFPTLKLAFLETGTDWVVRSVKQLRSRLGTQIDDWLSSRVFVACSVDDDLPYTIDKLGCDFLVCATDFPHGDAFREDLLLQRLEQRGDLSDQTIEKILATNPAVLYGD